MIEPRQMAQKETSCSLLATFHQPLKRLMFSSSWRIIVPVDGRRLGLAGERRLDLRHVLAHAEALLADPVGLDEVVGAARAGEHEAGEQRRDRDVTGRQRAEVAGVLAAGRPRRRGSIAATTAIARKTIVRPTLKNSALSSAL